MTQKKNPAREPKTKTDKEKFIERRREHTEGVEICPECGGDEVMPLRWVNLALRSLR